MSVNSIIHKESVDLSRRENNFVCLTTVRPSYILERFQGQGLEMIAQGPKAYDFWNISMTLTLDLAPAQFDSVEWEVIGPEDSPRSEDSNDTRPYRYIFCVDELPTFCRLLLELSTWSDLHLRSATIHIDVNEAIWKGHSTEIDHSPVGLSRMEKLLSPLRQLHSFGAAQIEGPLSGSYKASIITSLCKDCPTAIDIIEAAMVSLSQADELLGQNRSAPAISGYQVALNNVRSCCWLYSEGDFIFESGPFVGLKAEQAIHVLEVKLKGRIASVYLNCGMLRMARIYTERALDPARGFDYRYNRLHSLDLKPWQHTTYGDVLHVSAQLMYMDGHVSDAICEIRQAFRYTYKTNEEQMYRFVAWKEHEEKPSCRRAERAKSRALQIQREGEKTEGTETPETFNASLKRNN